MLCSLREPRLSERDDSAAERRTLDMVGAAGQAKAAQAAGTREDEAVADSRYRSDDSERACELSELGEFLDAATVDGRLAREGSKSPELAGAEAEASIAVDSEARIVGYPG